MIDPLRADQDPAPEPAPPAEAQMAAGPGAALSAERRSQGLSLGDIARQLKLSVRQIEALERDDYSAFSGMVFVRGFLRNYAKLLQLDADALLAHLPSPAPAGTPAIAAALALEAQPTEDRRGSRSAPGWLAGAAVLAALLVAAIYEGRQHQSAMPLPGAEQPSTGARTSPQHADSPPPGLAPANPPNELAQSATGPEPAAETGAAPDAPQAGPAVSDAVLAVPAAGPAADPIALPAQAAAPSVAPPAAAAVASVQNPAPAPSAPAGAAAASAQLRLAFEAEAWVEVKDASGAVIFSRLNSAGSEQVVQGVPPLQLLVGNAHGVKVSYRGRPVDLGPHTRVDVARLVLE